MLWKGIMELYALITKIGKYPITDKEDKIILFSLEQIQAALNGQLVNFKHKLIARGVIESNIPTDERSTSKDSKYVLVNKTDSKNVYIVSTKKTLGSLRPILFESEIAATTYKLSLEKQGYKIAMVEV